MVPPAQTAAAPERAVRGLKQTLDAVAKIGNTTPEALRASDSDLYPTALRQAFLLVMTFRHSDIAECAEAIKRPAVSAAILLASAKQAVQNPRSLVARYTRDLCAVCDADFPALRNTFNI